MSGITAQTSGGILGCAAEEVDAQRSSRSASVESRFVKRQSNPLSCVDRLLADTSGAISSFLTDDRKYPLWDSDERIRVSHSERASFHTEYREWRDCLRDRERRWLLQSK